MRTFKFRAFNKKTKRMIDPHAMTPLALNAECNADPNFKGVFLPFHEDLELIQFTGLKDRNGKEIFEDDVVRQFPNSEYATDFIIKWCAEKCGFYLYLTYKPDQPHLELADYREELYVIGNIYENPELLNKPKEGA